MLSLDWECLRQLHGVAQSLWIQLAAPRFEFTPIADRPGWEQAEVLLDEHAYHAFGVHASEDRFRRRTLNQAGERIVASDPAYEVFEAEGGRNRPSVLRVVRRCGTGAIAGPVTIEDPSTGSTLRSDYWPPRGSEWRDVGNPAPTVSGASACQPTPTRCERCRLNPPPVGVGVTWLCPGTPAS